MNSFNNTTNKIQIGIISVSTSDAKVAICVNLSANGSMSFPKLDIKLNFLAINPSAISVIADNVKNTKANK